MEEKINKILEILVETRTEQKELKETVGSIKTNQDRLEETVGTIKTNQDKLEETVGSIKSNQDRLEETVGTMKSNQDRLEEKVDSINRSVLIIEHEHGSKIQALLDVVTELDNRRLLKKRLEQNAIEYQHKKVIEAYRK